MFTTGIEGHQAKARRIREKNNLAVTMAKHVFTMKVPEFLNDHKTAVRIAYAIYAPVALLHLFLIPFASNDARWHERKAEKLRQKVSRN